MTIKVIRKKCLLQSHLDKRGITRYDLSIMTGLSLSQISLFNSGKAGMSLNNAATIAYALKININELFEWEIITIE